MKSNSWQWDGHKNCHPSQCHKVNGQDNQGNVMMLPRKACLHLDPQMERDIAYYCA